MHQVCWAVWLMAPLVVALAVHEFELELLAWAHHLVLESGVGVAGQASAAAAAVESASVAVWPAAGVH